jgi:hypothetical protein
MRKFIGTLVLCSSIVAFAGWESLVAGVNFGSRDSGFYVFTGGRLNNGSSNFFINGTLGLAGTPELTGRDIYFQGGLLEQNGIQSLLDGAFNLLEGGAIALTGNKSLHAQARSSFSGIAVSGPGNVVDGVLKLTAPITLADSQSALSIGLENVLTQNVMLNGGTLTLASDLRFTKNVAIVGPGKVDQQNFQIYSGLISNTTNQNITYVNGTGPVLAPFDNHTLPPVLTGGTQTDGQVINLTNLECLVSHDLPIDITAKNLVIDGAGGSMVFVGAMGQSVGLGSQGGPLFKVAPNSSVTLRNITLTNITQDSFELGNGATLALDENVTLDFGSDVFLTSGTLKIVNSTTLLGGSNVIRMRGINGKKKLVLSPTNANQTTMIDLNNNSLALQNMELVGTEFITPNGRMASVALAGGSTVDVSVSTGLNFDVEDTNNTLVLTQDGLTLSGAFNFDGLAAENILSVRFALNGSVADKKVTMIDASGKISYVSVKKGNPLVVFDGDTGLFLTNQSTLAGLIFQDQSVTIANGLNTNTNGFIIDQNSFLMGLDLEILCHPIKQQSAYFALEARSMTGLGIDQGFVRARKASTPRVLTAYGKMLEHRRANKPVAKMRPIVKPQVTQAKVNAALAKNSKMLTRSPEGFIPEDIDCEYVRSFSPSSEYVRRVVGTTVTNASVESGPALYKGAVVYDFQTASNSVCTITMESGAELNQLLGSTLYIDNGHNLNVSGLGNKLVVTGDAVIDLSSIGFDDKSASSLTIKCDRAGAALPVITLRGKLDLPPTAACLLEGVGSVVLSDGTVILFNGVPDNQPVFSVGGGVVLSLAPRAKAYVGGIGRFEVVNAGQLTINNRATLSFADAPSSMAHSINFIMQCNGLVTVGGDADQGMLRFAGNGDVSFTSDKSRLVIGSSGRVVFNMDAAGGVQRGLLKAFRLNYADIILRGRLEFGPNELDESFKDLMTQFLLTETKISGEGAVIAHNQNPVSKAVSDVSTLVPLAATLTGVHVAATPASIVNFVKRA